MLLIKGQEFKLHDMHYVDIMLSLNIIETKGIQ